jgi:hypothetical protein
MGTQSSWSCKAGRAGGASRAGKQAGPRSGGEGVSGVLWACVNCPQGEAALPPPYSCIQLLPAPAHLVAEFQQPLLLPAALQQVEEGLQVQALRLLHPQQLVQGSHRVAPHVLPATVPAEHPPLAAALQHQAADPAGREWGRGGAHRESCRTLAQPQFNAFPDTASWAERRPLPLHLRLTSR